MLPRGSSTQSSVGLSLGPSRGWRSCTQTYLEMGGVTQRGPSEAQVSKNPEWPSREGKVWSFEEKRVRSRERVSPFTCCRSKCFIPVGGELACTPSLTFVVSRDMAETYKGRAAVAAWSEGIAHHATLMGVGIASTPSFSVSSFSSSLSSPVPPSREERRRSNDSSGNQSVPESSSSSVMTRDEAKVLQALEVMKSLHDFDSTICLESLRSVRKRFSIPNEYVLHAHRSGQRPYHPCPGGFGVSIDALKAGLRFPLHPVIEECLSWWRVSPNQIAPNSWRYIITFPGSVRVRESSRVETCSYPTFVCVGVRGITI
ncbi:hypothetical protein BHM03_00044149 [Ensete ventricosum]|nr:hypothetical protein BHM03_00044149 [Ensete ventricosum]